MDDDTVDARRWLVLELAGAHSAELDWEAILPGTDETVALRAETERAAENGDIEALYLLGLADDALIRLVSAERWWARAAALDDPGAMFNLGVYAYREHDIAEARRWWARAADAGVHDAARNLRVLDREVARRDGQVLIRRFPPGEGPM